MRRPSALVLAGLAVGCATVAAPVVPGPVEVAAPDPAAPRAALVSALARGDTDAVWALLGEGPRTTFATRADFDAWCRRHAADWLVLLSQPHSEPVLEWHFGAVVVQGVGDDAWGVVRSPALPESRTYEAVLARLRRLAETLSAQAVLDPSLQRRWHALAEALDGLSRQPAPPGALPVTLATPPGTRVTVRASEGGWAVLDFGVDG